MSPSNTNSTACLVIISCHFWDPAGSTPLVITGRASALSRFTECVNSIPRWPEISFAIFTIFVFSPVNVLNGAAHSSYD
jgi:hypothetical protein